MDTSNPQTTILSTLVSFIPFGIGDVLSSGIQSFNDYITGNKIINEARLLKKLAIDAVELSTIAGGVALLIIKNKDYQTKIFHAKEEDPDGVIQKLKAYIVEKAKLVDKNLAEEKLHKTPAAALGQSDANKLIQEWLK